MKGAILQQLPGFSSATELQTLDPNAQRLSDRISFLPMYLLLNCAFMGLFIVAAYVFMDKEEGTIRALTVTPVTVRDYLASKLLVMLFTGLLTGLLVTSLVAGTRVHYQWLILILVAGNLFGTVLGLFIASFYQSILSSLGAMYAIIVLLGLGGVPYYMPSFSPLVLRAAVLPAALCLSRGVLGATGYRADPSHCRRHRTGDGAPVCGDRATLPPHADHLRGCPMKNILLIFRRDLKASLRDAMVVYILVIPFLIALVLNLLTTSTAGAALRVVVDPTVDQAVTDHLETMARVERAGDRASLERRVRDLDDVYGLSQSDGRMLILRQGNEKVPLEEVLKLALDTKDQAVLSGAVGVRVSDIGWRLSPVKQYGGSLLAVFVTVFGAMVLMIHLVEEKQENTLAAMNVTPVKRWEYVAGKSLLGFLLPVVHVLAILVILNYGAINYAMALVITLALVLITVTTGFAIGVKTDNVIVAISALKMMFFPFWVLSSRRSTLARVCMSCSGGRHFTGPSGRWTASSCKPPPGASSSLPPPSSWSLPWWCLPSFPKTSAGG